MTSADSTQVVGRVTSVLLGFRVISPTYNFLNVQIFLWIVKLNFMFCKQKHCTQTRMYFSLYLNIRLFQNTGLVESRSFTPET